MAQRKGGLGRGLGALIPSQTAAEGGVQEIELDAISPNPFQPRETFAPADLEALAASIREHGVIQPLILARGTDGTPFQLIVGERRWRAARLAGLRSVPAIVRESTSQGLLELALIENIQRADLSVLEEAAAYRQLIAEFGCSQAEVAERIGRSRVAITNALRILDAPDEIKEALSGGGGTRGGARGVLGGGGPPGRGGGGL